jgi:hypothetical protein
VVAIPDEGCGVEAEVTEAEARGAAGEVRDRIPERAESSDGQLTLIEREGLAAASMEACRFMTLDGSRP